MSTTTRKPCPITGAQFEAAAGALSVTLGDVGADGPPGDAALTLDPREFSTGSVGYYGNGKITALIGGARVPCQVGVNVTAIGSKAWTPERKAAVLARLQAQPCRFYFGEGGKIPATTMAPFSTGSFGWNVNAKHTSPQGDHFQVGINVTVIGSKP